MKYRGRWRSLTARHQAIRSGSTQSIWLRTSDGLRTTTADAHGQGQFLQSGERSQRFALAIPPLNYNQSYHPSFSLAFLLFDFEIVHRQNLAVFCQDGHLKSGCNKGPSPSSQRLRVETKMHQCKLTTCNSNLQVNAFMPRTPIVDFFYVFDFVLKIIPL